jgi:hypothetical protein
MRLEIDITTLCFLIIFNAGVFSQLFLVITGTEKRNQNTQEVKMNAI